MATFNFDEARIRGKDEFLLWFLIRSMNRRDPQQTDLFGTGPQVEVTMQINGVEVDALATLRDVANSWDQVVKQGAKDALEASMNDVVSAAYKLVELAEREEEDWCKRIYPPSPERYCGVE